MLRSTKLLAVTSANRHGGRPGTTAAEVTAVFGAWRYVVTARGLREERVVPLSRAPVVISAIAVSIVCLVVAFDLVLVR